MSASGSNGRKDHPNHEAHNVHHYPFWFGGSASCFAAAVTHPLDLIKVRLQTRAPDGPKGMFGTLVHILKTDSVLGLYRGLSASLLRQLTYSTTRFGVYAELKEHFTTPTSTPSLPTLIAMASTSGLLGGIAGNPADVLNVRMQHDRSLPPAQRRNYRNAIVGGYRMVTEEGWRSLFRGVWPNSARAVLMTAGQLGTYDSTKRLLLERAGWRDGTGTHLVASAVAGFVATTVCSPVDVLKTRVMSAGAAGPEKKEGMLLFLRRISEREGVAWVFRGWVPSFVRLGPHTVVTFLFLEQHKRVWRRVKGWEEE